MIKGFLTESDGVTWSSRRLAMIYGYLVSSVCVLIDVYKYGLDSYSVAILMAMLGAGAGAVVAGRKSENA